MPEPTPTTHPMSFRLSPQAREILATITARTGLNRSAVVEVALRQLLAAGSIPFADPPAPPPGPPAKSAKRA
jgi:antitoxin component of RelBE/YafQ-DinJ toxin-antitoxin module